MADFYDVEMPSMVDDLLTSSKQGGLGQGHVELIRTTMVEDPEQSWKDPVRVPVSEVVKAAVTVVSKSNGSSQYMEGTTILEGDLKIVMTPPKTIDYLPGGNDNAVFTVRIDHGIEIPVVAIRSIPEAGTPSALIVYARGPKRK